ncbi:MAG: hypothetical protein ED555_10840 [Allomuricauda sp.]|nr:MAG: hypothetical protein ED555_10840 [Allomuricauda sp.]
MLQILIAQDKGRQVFDDQTPLSIQMELSFKEVRKNTNDSTYIATKLAYQVDEGEWEVLEASIRKRGRSRLERCYFAPIKLKIKKKEAKGTLFQGKRKLKLVLPCQMTQDKNDNVIKEFLAYRMFEELSPYHFKTRLLNITLVEHRGNKEKTHHIKGFFIEDLEELEDRFNAKELKREVHPLQQENLCSFRNDLFQYMIGNTDFSIAYQHNVKLLFFPDKSVIPIPYDFDMSGLVNASYSFVSKPEGAQAPIKTVTDRWFRGFKRDEALCWKIRQEFLGKKEKIFTLFDSYKGYFDNENEFQEAKNFIQSFYLQIGNNATYKSEVLAKSRIK